MEEPIVYRYLNKEYELRLDAPAIERFENLCDAGLFGFYRRMVEGKPPKHTDAQKLLWATAQSKNAEWTLRMAQEVTPVHAYPKLLEALTRLLVKSLTDPDAQPPEEASDRPLAGASTSTPSEK